MLSEATTDRQTTDRDWQTDQRATSRQATADTQTSKGDRLLGGWTDHEDIDIDKRW